MSHDSSQPNALIEEPSPYLQQHAYNPIRWFPWKPEVLERARREDKMIFLSIGYSTCHWCHVMEEETFEDDGVAALMEKDFIAIKVDREERPDIDAIYMNFIQAFSGNGGWPLNVWLTPDLKPIYGGTYFPKEDRQGSVGFTTLIEELSNGWANIREKLSTQADAYTQHLKKMSEPSPSSGVSEAFLLATFDSIRGNYDVQSGGFSMSPKFPQPSFLRFLLGFYKHDRVEQALREEAKVMICQTLDHMAQSGIHDILEGGFHRYAVDENWKVPHFEKMLYDQALVSRVYLQAAQLFGEDRYLQVGVKILDFVEAKLRNDQGGFLSAWDADSLDYDGVKREGAYYLFDWKELEESLTDGELSILANSYHFTPQGNIEKELDPHHEMLGKNILHASKWLELSEEIAGKLKEIRAKKSLPHLDDKVVTSWNGLMISAYTQAYAQTGNVRFLKIAEASHDFIKNNLITQDGELMRSCRLGKISVSAVAADYANWVAALLDLFEVTGSTVFFEDAVAYQKKFDEEFLEENGGYRNQSINNSEDQLMSLQDHYDGAEPSANAIVCQNLIRFYTFTQKKEFLSRAESLLQAFGQVLEQSPLGTTELQLALLKFFRLESFLIPAQASNFDGLRKEWLQRQFGHATIVSNNQPQEAKPEVESEAQKGSRNEAHEQVMHCEGRSCRLLE